MRSCVSGRGDCIPFTRRSMLVASKMPITIGKLRSPSTSLRMITCCSSTSLMMIRRSSICTGTAASRLQFPRASHIAQNAARGLRRGAQLAPSSYTIPMPVVLLTRVYAVGRSPPVARRGQVRGSRSCAGFDPVRGLHGDRRGAIDVGEFSFRPHSKNTALAGGTRRRSLTPCVDLTDNG